MDFEDKPAPVPDLDWDAERARRFADRTADIWQELLTRLRDLPITPGAPPDKVRAAVSIPVPEEPMSEDALFDYLRSMTFDWSMYTGHPRFMAYITGSGTVPGAAADLLASGINMNVGGFQLSPAATEIEVHLTRWFAERFGLPETAGGLLVSGGAMANFVALKTARDHRAGWDVRAEGVSSGPPLTVYASAEVHVTTSREADMLGLGDRSVRLLPVDGDYRIRMDLLREAIRRDREQGLRPFAVVG